MYKQNENLFCFYLFCIGKLLDYHDVKTVYFNVYSYNIDMQNIHSTKNVELIQLRINMKCCKYMTIVYPMMLILLYKIILNEESTTLSVWCRIKNLSFLVTLHYQLYL